MHVLLRSLKIVVLLLLRLPELAVSAAYLRFTIQRWHVVDLREESLQFSQLHLEILSLLILRCPLRRRIQSDLSPQVLAVIIPRLLARVVLDGNVGPICLARRTTFNTHFLTDYLVDESCVIAYPLDLGRR